MLFTGEVLFDVYSLFCHYMVDRLESLSVACGDRKQSFAWCIERFDESLRVLFENRIADRSLAFDSVSQNLQTMVGNLGISNREAAKIVAEAREEALDHKDSWSYAQAMGICHEQGRDLAVLFFENSKWPVTQQRTNLRATPTYQFGRARAAQERARLLDQPPSLKRDELIELSYANELRELKQKYEGLPGAPYTFEGKKNGDYSINVPLTPGNGVMLYASYPFLFMHEYTAHIFANDYLNDRFNDGWMLYAASQYLVENWARDPADERLSVLNRVQAYAFRRYLAHTLIGESIEHHDSAEDLYDFLRSWDPARFESITYELAAYKPAERESDKWPAYVLKALASDVQDRSTLRKRMEAAQSLTDLYPGLKLKLPHIGGV